MFEMLAASPGAVVSRPALLAHVWGSATADPHALETTVGRLRRRLGPAASPSARAAGVATSSIPQRRSPLHPELPDAGHGFLPPEVTFRQYACPRWCSRGRPLPHECSLLAAVQFEPGPLRRAAGAGAAASVARSA